MAENEVWLTAVGFVGTRRITVVLRSMSLQMDLGICYLILCCNLLEVQPTYQLPKGRRIGRQRCYDEKQAVHRNWLLTEVVWQGRQCKA